MKIVLVFLLFFLSLQVQAATLYGTTTEQKELLIWIWQKAQRFSMITSQQGDQRLESLPIYLLSEEELSLAACPEDPQNCRGLAALYDTKEVRILLRTDLNPEDGNIAISFLLHELVHALQHEQHSEDDLFGNCEKLFNTEKQAYESQDAFLKSEGEFFRAGTALRFFNCTDK